MKKVWLVSLALLAHTAIGAEEKILFDFENYAIGETIPMNDIFNGSNTESRATVVADPINAQNKVLHITNKSWNTTVEFTLDQMTAEEITGDYQYLAFDLYRRRIQTVLSPHRSRYYLCRCRLCNAGCRRSVG